MLIYADWINNLVLRKCIQDRCRVIPRMVGTLCGRRRCAVLPQFYHPPSCHSSPSQPSTRHLSSWVPSSCHLPSHPPCQPPPCDFPFQDGRRHLLLVFDVLYLPELVPPDEPPDSLPLPELSPQYFHSLSSRSFSSASTRSSFCCFCDSCARSLSRPVSSPLAPSSTQRKTSSSSPSLSPSLFVLTLNSASTKSSVSFDADLHGEKHGRIWWMSCGTVPSMIE